MKKLFSLAVLFLGFAAWAQNPGVIFPSGMVLNPNNPAGGGWPNATVEFIDSVSPNLMASYTTTTDANGSYFDSIPTLAGSGVFMIRIVECSGNVLQVVHPYTIPVFGGPTLSFTDAFTSTCVASGGGGGGGSLALYVSGYVMGSALPSGIWANADVVVTVDNSTYTLTTDQNGFYSDSLPTTLTTGTVLASVADCNGNVTYGNPYNYDFATGQLTPYDTISVSCLPSSGTGGCQASFAIDTANSFGGNLYLWNTSVASSPNIPLQFVWDFGDGTFSNLHYPSHQYAQPGMYQVCLTVVEPSTPLFPGCTSTYCDSLGMDANGNLIYKGQATGFNLIVIDPSTVGQEENELLEVTVYPNPAEDHIKIEGLLQPVDYRLMDAYGRILKQGQLSPAEALLLPDMSQGVYILDLQSGGKYAQHRLLVD
jgi:hypothetical protein